MTASRLLRTVTTIVLLIGAIGGIQVSPKALAQTPTVTTSLPLTSQSFPGPPCLPPSQADISTAQFQAEGQNVSIPGHVVPTVRSGKALRTGDLSNSSILYLELVFSLRNAAVFKQCLDSLTDPTSPNFGHFLDATSLEPYVPTPGQKRSMTVFLQRAGFTVSEGASPIVLDLTGSVRTVSRIFSTRVELYRQGNNSFYSPDSDPVLPQNLAALTNAVMGLDNSSKVTREETPCGLLGLHPDCPQGVQIGYGLSNLYSSGYSGNGVTVAIVDLPGEPNPSSALNTYDSQYGLPAPSSLQVLCGGGTSWTACTLPISSYDPGWGAEAAMDVESVHTVAPGAGITLFYGTGSNIGPLYDPLVDAIDYVAKNHLASIVSNSWSWCECSDSEIASSTLSAADSRLALDAGQGLTIIFASGDNGARPDGTNLGAEFPASDPNVLAVGATNLNLAGCGINTCSGYGSETGASISGGGYSGYFPEPSWQTLTVGLKPGRAVPDVSMFGYSPNFWVYSTQSDDCQGDSVNRGAAWFGCAGTSLSTPLWAGFLAVALQVRGGGGFGNISPRLYQLANSPSYSSDFHDITSGSNNGYSAVTGWDPVTGWGTPIANTLAYDLSQIVVSTDKSTYTQDDFLQYTGTGLTPGGSVGTCLSTDNDGALVCTSTTSDSNGDIAGSMQIGTNIPPGPQKFVVVDISTDRYSNSVQLTILKLTITTILFHTTPATFTGPTNPGSISACSGTFTDGQSAPCGATFSATANLPTPSSGWQFDHWTWSGGVTCTTNGNTASCSSSSSGGSLTAVYAAQVSFQTNPSSSALISWGSCGAPGEGNGQSIFSTSYGSVTACYVPSGYTLSSWSCSGGLACSGLNDPTLVTFNGPGTITMNLKTGSLSNPVSTSLITSASPANPVHGTSFTVSGTLTANGGGVGGETIVLVFGWTSNTVTVTTKADGSYTYTAMAPATAGSYKVQVFFLGDYGGTPQYLPSTATASITAT